MKLYHVNVTQDDGWYVGQVLEREGVTTQGKTLDELVFMVRDAISLMWDETGVQLELILPGQDSTAAKVKRRQAGSRIGHKASLLAKPRKIAAK